jgi:MFS family permease
MWEKFQRVLDRVESRVALWTLIQGGGIVSGGAISGWLASGHAWVASHGAFGWWAAFLVGALITATALMAFAALRYLWIRGDAVREWKNRAQDVNPLAPEYHTARVSIAQIANPISKKIKGKRFIDCEILGPANLFLIRNVNIDNIGFMNCDFVVIKRGAKAIFNCVGLEDVRILGGTMWECTIMVPPDMAPGLAAKGIQFVTLTGDAALDAPAGNQANR